MDGYHGLPEKTAKVMRPGGFYHTSDILRRDDDGFRVVILAIGDHLFRRAHFVREKTDGLGALGVGDEWRVWIFFADLSDAGVCPLDVDVAIALPKLHRPPGLFDHPRAEILVGNE